MNTNGSDTAKNGLTVCVDWLSFTLTSSIEPTDAFSLLGYSKDNFYELPSGRYGYKKCYKHLTHNVHVLYDGNDGMGVHVDVSGSAIDEVLHSYHDKHCVQTPFGVAYESSSGEFDPEKDDMGSTVLADLLSDVLSVGKITRLDLAVDDMDAFYFTMNDLQNLFESGSCSTRFKGFRQDKETSFSGKVTGNTFYLGSRKSECMVRIYDKQLEQNKKLKQAKKTTCGTSMGSLGTGIKRRACKRCFQNSCVRNASR